jgi:hypothetical protein
MLNRFVTVILAALWTPLALAQASTNVTRTTWEIYAIVGLTFVIGYLWVLFKTRKKEAQRKQRGSAMG